MISSLNLEDAFSPHDTGNLSFHLNFPKYRDKCLNPNYHGIQIIFPAT